MAITVAALWLYTGGGRTQETLPCTWPYCALKAIRPAFSKTTYPKYSADRKTKLEAAL